MADDLSGKISLDTADFKSGIATMNRELRVLESGFRASAAGLGDWAKDATGLEMRMKSLSAQIDVQKSKVSALEGEYKRVAAEKGANSIAAQNLLIKLNKETETLGKMESELGKTEKALSEMGDESGQAAQDTDKLEKEEGQATSATKKFSDALHGLEGKLKAGVSGLGKMVVGVGKLAVGMAVGLAAGAVAAVAGVGALVVKTAAASDELVETAEKMGITTTKLQELNYIAEQTGTGVDTMQTALSRMTRSLDDVEKEGTPAQMAFERLGVSVRDSSGQFRDNKDILFESIAALGEVENATERDALAMELFGRSALELNPLINLGAEGMAAMAGEAHALGAVMSEESVTGMADLNDALAGLKAGFMGMVGTLATAFLPILNEVVAFIQTSVIPWLQENLPKAIQVLSDFWSGTLQPAITAVWAWMSGTLMPFLQGTVYPWLQENIPKALQVLSDFWTNVLQPAITAVWAWMSGTLMPFLQTVVFPWLQTNIPKALQVLSDFWTNVLLPAITTVWSWMTGTLIPFLGTLVTWLSTTITGALQVLSDFWTNTLLPAITTVWDYLSTYVVPIFEALWDLLEVAGGVAIAAISLLWTGTLQPALKAVWSFIQDNLIPIFEDIWGWFNDKLAGPINSLVDGALAGLTSAFEGIRDAIQWVIDKLVALQTKLGLVKIPPNLKEDSPSPLAQTFIHASEAVDMLANKSLANLSRKLREDINLSLSGYGSMAGAAKSEVHNSWSYTIQAANPLQSSDDLVRQVRLLELMHG